MLVYYFVLLYCLCCGCHALAVTHAKAPQTAFYLQQTQPFEVNSDYSSEEYILYTEVVQHYENLVDTALNSQSEELFLYLIYMPTESRCQLLKAQVQFLGIDQTMSRNQLLKIPTIISKHVQSMNAHIYESIDPIIQRHWKTLWENRLLEPSRIETELSYLLSSLNSILATQLIEQMDAYQLVERVQQDIRMMIQGTEVESMSHRWLSWLSHPLLVVSRSYQAQSKPWAHQEVDFLRQHLADLRVQLLMELHLQFVDLFSRMKADIIEQLNEYYDELE
ncbi:hypothetical protein EDC96DRAFT_469205 [Choanephora cucurbitarum]|nr:hypothetical protein EDC96DRAFT_469205 [Choanephora cucurbitarum]